MPHDREEDPSDSETPPKPSCLSADISAQTAP